MHIEKINCNELKSVEKLTVVIKNSSVELSLAQMFNGMMPQDLDGRNF